MVGTEKKMCVILGGGGHAKVVIDCLEASGLAIPYGVLDSDKNLWDREILGVPIRGGDDLIQQLKKEGVVYFMVGVGGVRDNGPRRRVFELGVESGLIPLTLQHPSAVCSRWAKIGDGTLIAAGAVVSTAAVIGKNCIINTGALVDHDCIIEDHVHVATGARLSGAVRVGRGAHVGTGACIRHGISIGEEAIVGAGGVVVKEVPPKTVVKGIPAK